MTADRRHSIRFDHGIVVGVDESPVAEHVVRIAEELSRRLSVPVHRVHAVPRLPDVWPGLDPARSEALTVELLDAARRAVDDRVRPIVAESGVQAAPALEIGKDRPGASVRTDGALVEVVPGHPAEVLLEEVRHRKADMLVLGAHGKREFPDFGSTLRAAYAKSTVPVWVQPGPVSPIRRILAAIDLSQDSLLALVAARALAKAFGAEIHAIHCGPTNAVTFGLDVEKTFGVLDFPLEKILRADREGFESAMKEFDWQGVPHETEFLQAFPVATLLDRSKAADLLVLGTHGRTGLASVVLGGVAYSVLKQATKPTLAVPRFGRKFRI